MYHVRHPPWRYLFGSWCDARDFEPIGIANLISVVSYGARQAICTPYPQWIKRLRGSRWGKVGVESEGIDER